MLNYGYYHVAAALMPLCIGDVSANAAQIERIANSCAPDTQLIAFPELSICGYTCGDLFFESLLLDACEKALQTLCTDQRKPDLRRRRPAAAKRTALQLRGRDLQS